jgi:hypothetical protein
MPTGSYVVVLRARSAIRVRDDEAFVIPCSFQDRSHTINLVFRTLWVDEGYEATVPRGLIVEATGPAPSLSDAMNTFRSVAIPGPDRLRPHSPT